MKRLTAGIGIAAVVVVGGFVTNSFLSSQAEVSSLESVADRFHPGPGWAQNENRVLGTFLCTGGDVPCGSVLRRWHTDHRPTLAEFQGLVHAAGWNFPVDGNCQQPSKVTGPIELCSAHGSVDTYHVDVAVVSDGSGGPDLVSLRIVRANS